MLCTYLKLRQPASGTEAICLSLDLCYEQMWFLSWGAKGIHCMVQLSVNMHLHMSKAMVQASAHPAAAGRGSWAAIGFAS